MNVPYQIKVPLSAAVDIQARLGSLQEIHRAEVAKLDIKIKSGKGDAKKLSAERATLIARGSLLTIPNMLRVAIMHGVPGLKAMKDVEIFKHLADTGLRRGRPSAA